MAARPGITLDRPPPAPSYSHQPLAASDALLASALDLPSNPCIVYARFTPTHATNNPQDALEAARRSILSRNASKSLLDSLLPSVHISSSDPFVCIFKLTEATAADSTTGYLRTLVFDGLTVHQVSSFAPPSSSSLLPNPDVRNVTAHFYQAVRLRIIDDIVRASSKPQASSIRRLVRRFKDGFLMSQISSSSSDWEYGAITRPLIFCQLQVHFSYSPGGSPSHLVVHPTLVPTPFLDISRALPLPAGTPITLLPFGTPAYFLASYSGPTAGLIKQFQTSLQGLGAGDWESVPKSSTDQTPPFIIGWIKVENKQGEDKGLTIIYPSRLCLSYAPYSSSRPPLEHIPELPAPLQPSPQAAPAIPPGNFSPLDPVRPASTPITSHPKRPPIFTTPTTESLYSFRALTLSKAKDLRSIATEVGGYVDAVARERERERERLKRERETGTNCSPKLIRTAATTPAAVPTPTTVDLSLSTTSFSPPPLPGGPSQLQQAPPPASGPQLQPSLNIQHFYPSPPQTAPSATNTSTEAKTSPTIEASPSYPLPESTPTAADVPSESLNPPIPATVLPTPSASASSNSTAYDPYPMDTTWSSQPGDSYLAMDMNMDFEMDDMMDFGLNIGSMSGGTNSSGLDSMGMGMSISGLSSGATSFGDRRNVSLGSVTGGNMEFEDAFTDDDFSFFDRPQRAVPIPPAPAHPPVPANVAPVMSHSRDASGSGLLAASALPVNSPPNFGDVHQSGGPGPPAPFNASLHHAGPSGTTHNQQMWTPGGFMDGFTPRSLDHPDSVPPELLPSSPGQTPESHSAPATPNVHLEFGGSAAGSSSNSNHYGGKLFEPIPFAPYHRQADGKYFAGKFSFSLPTPPADGDETVAGFVSLPSSPNGWRNQYNAATDPRIGVVKKLIGVKRKTPFAHAARNAPRSCSWLSQEEWEKPHSSSKEDDAKSDVESEASSEDSEVEEEEEAEDIDTPMLSRPATPPPSYLPLGPSLLATQFSHMHLLPLAQPVRPPGSALDDLSPIALVSATSTSSHHPNPHPITINPPPSVPTPVSPAATMGAASEKSRSFEAAAFAVAAEVVENPLWAETWHANAVGAKPAAAVWATDVRAVSKLMGIALGCKNEEGCFTIEDLFGLHVSATDKTLRPLEAPMVSIGKSSVIGKGDAIMEVLPSALRFWEKLGLKPKGGRKDLSVFVLFEDDGDKTPLMQSWLSAVMNTYQARHYGLMTPGKSTSPVDGLVPLRFDASFRKNLSTFFSRLPASQPTTMIFMIVPASMMTLSSPTLRQILSVSKKMLANSLPCKIAFEFVPEQAILSVLERSTAYDPALDVLTSSVYNRILVPIERSRARRIPPFDVDSTSYLMAPSFTLARPVYNKVSYVRSAHTSLDVMDRYTLLHVGYHLSSCGKWIIACCVDQRAEMYDLGVWLTQSPTNGGPEHESAEGEATAVVSDEEYAVKKVWDFAMQFSRKTNVEWRVIFARLGVLNKKEMNGMDILSSSLTETDLSIRSLDESTEQRRRPILRQTAVTPQPYVTTPPPSTSNTRPSPPGRSPSSSKPHTVFTDTSSTTYAIHPLNRMPISLPPSQIDLGLEQSFVPESASLSSTPSPQPHTSIPTPLASAPTPAADFVPTPSSVSTCHPHPLSFLPLHTSHLIRIPSKTSSTSISSLSSLFSTVITQISTHLLCTVHSSSYNHPIQASSPSAQAPSDEQLMVDVTRNFYELGVLGRARLKSGKETGGQDLPFHLAAVDSMRVALERDWDRLDAGVDG
ncbi:unnamed protein product [Cyclocybe aegerita]|uniref:Mediator of RNA polymerase II transcription subunit 13 n=1 Tax=Cyclocybe aegerita TaxID=1973307 RepID=A0A8S0VTF0_CYCAE|nr:unnamed protein product [Cyclocybe aegerita]